MLRVIIEGLFSLVNFCISSEVTTEFFHEEVDPVFFEKLAKAELGLLVLADVLRTVYFIVVDWLNLLLLAGRSIIEILRIVNNKRLWCIVFTDLNVFIFTFFI